MAVNAVIQFLKAAKSLADQGMSKEAIEQFARNEFGQINELFQAQINNIFKPKKGIENIKIKDPDFDDTVVKMQFDDAGVPFNPKDPLKTKTLTYEEAVAKEKAKAAADEDYIMKIFDPEDFAKGGRAGHYTGGMVDVEPNLSDIGHGSDALMARTRLISPGAQGTTSTGLNYLLAEDNDNIRIPFADAGDVYKRYQDYVMEMDADLLKHFKRYKKIYGGKMNMKQFAPKFIENYAEGGRIGFSKGKLALADAARRKFLKLAGSGAAGLAALKTGLLGFGKEAAPVIEKAVETAKGVPPYFFQLVDLIKSKGREIESYGERVKQYISPSKDGKSELMLTEDLNTGDIQVKKIFKENDDMVTKSEEMNFTKGRGDESTKGTPADDYEEVTEYNSRIYKDNFNDPDFVDGIDVEEIVKEIDVKKAEGGRIGYSKAGFVLDKTLKGLDYLKELFKKKPEKLETVNDFVDKRRFLKTMVGNTEKNERARELTMLKEAIEKARKEGGYKFKDIDVDKEIRPIFDQSKDRKLQAQGGLTTMLGE